MQPGGRSGSRLRSLDGRISRPRRVTLLLPSDCERYTGGYIWESRVVRELRELGWTVDERELPPGFPHPGPAARAGSASTRRCSS